MKNRSWEIAALTLAGYLTIVIPSAKSGDSLLVKILIGIFFSAALGKFAGSRV
jgi:hypothetical protein